MKPAFTFSFSVLATSLLSACAHLGAPTAGEPSAPTAPAASAGAPSSAPASAVAKPAASTASAAVAGASAAASASARPASAASAPAAGAPRPFTEVIKDAKEHAGLFPLWRKDDKIWIEIGEKQFNQPFLFSINFANSVGERGLYSSMMGPSWMVEWRKVGNRIQLVALNEMFRATGDAPMQRTLDQSFSDSLIVSGPVASAPHTTKKSVLVDADFLLADVANYSMNAEFAFRMTYGVDKPNSSFGTHTTQSDLTSVAAQLHFSTARIPLPPTTPPPPGTPVPTPPRVTPDARSFFVTKIYNFAALPEQPMATRAGDGRVGHFFIKPRELGSDIQFNPDRYYIARWRLEKKDPAAALTEPKQPITYWLDKNIPVRYRKAVTDGILEWNKAFEAIGFKNAIVAKQQPDDATWDNLDTRHASIRWFTGADVGFAIGPSNLDPRTGEILDADIGMSDVWARGARRFFAEATARSMGSAHLNGIDEIAMDWPGVYGMKASDGTDAGSHDKLRALMGNVASHRGHEHVAGQCMYSMHTAREMHFAMDILEARGEFDPDSPEAEAFVQSVIKDTIVHEVGHTLGLKHNFKASTTIKAADLRKPGLVSNSTMDYNPYNIPLEGEPKGSINMEGIGAYDYWAIAYAYSEFPKDQEAAGLAKIIARHTEPQLAFADDVDAGGWIGSPIDPLANRFDLSDDPMAYYKKRVKLSQELWQRVSKRSPKVGDDPLRLRRNLTGGFSALDRAVSLVGKYVGGMHVARDLPSPTARKTYTPVDPAKQREATTFITDTLFQTTSFQFSPDVLTRVGVDFRDWTRDQPLSVPALVGSIQANALSQLMSPSVAQRLIELPNYVNASDRKGLFSLAELYQTVQAAIWSELRSGGDIDSLRRNLQRAHLSRVVSHLTKPGGLPADGLSIVRLQARDLQAQLSRAAANPRANIETRAHLSDALSQLNEALKATMTRS